MVQKNNKTNPNNKNNKNNKNNNNKSKGERLQEKLFCKKESAWKTTDKQIQSAAFKFGDKYTKFINQVKTEREAVTYIKSLAIKNGFSDISKKSKLKSGDKVFAINKNKNIILCTVGKSPKDLKLIASHIDSPRLDLKVNPLFEDSEIAFFKTNYYGGIKKYHWVNTPLSIHGVIFLKSGKKVEINIGEKDSDPIFIISDLLPHLARNFMKKPATTVVEGEQLNVIVGNIPFDDEKVKNKVKLKVLDLLNKKYQITEEDFVSAELEMVPATKARNLGFDESLIAGYGHDDKSCSFANLRAALDCKNPKSTNLALFVDKEETGSDAATGAKSAFLKHFIHNILEKSGLAKDRHNIMDNLIAISADVTAGVNPMFKEVHELHNAAFIGRGVAIDKYGGGGGKYSTADASAETMSYFRNLLNKNNIAWQTALLGKVDCGGGGTIAMFISQALNCNIIDIGVPVLGMHSPYEVLSKIDLYETYRIYKAFFSN